LSPACLLLRLEMPRDNDGHGHSGDNGGRDTTHLSLGMTCAGLIKFQEFIGFPAAYTRSPESAWITEQYGEQLTGYDFGEAVRAWLRRTGNEHLSACEALKAQSAFWCANIGTAQVFYSHIQQLSISQTTQTLMWCTKNRSLLQRGKDSWCLDRRDIYDLVRNSCADPTTAATLDDAGDDTWLEFDPYFWVDYVVLRQGQNDFDPPSIIRLIGQIGCTVLEVDHEAEYFRRSWCIMECWATANPECPWGPMLSHQAWRQ
jgi:hypothetical protein